MTKKDYIKIAQCLKDSKPIVNFPERLDTNYQTQKQWNITVETFAYMLAHNNARFNRNRFLHACGYGE